MFFPIKKRGKRNLVVSAVNVAVGLWWMRCRHWPRDKVTERKHDSDSEGNEAPVHGFVAAEFHRTWVAAGGNG